MTYPQSGPSYGQPQGGQPQYGASQQYGQPAYGQPAYGQPAYGQPPVSQPPANQPQFGAPQPYGQPSAPQFAAPKPPSPGLPANIGQILAIVTGAFGVITLIVGFLVGMPFAYVTPWLLFAVAGVMALLTLIAGADKLYVAAVTALSAVALLASLGMMITDGGGTGAIIVLVFSFLGTIAAVVWLLAEAGKVKVAPAAGAASSADTAATSTPAAATSFVAPEYPSAPAPSAPAAPSYGSTPATPLHDSTAAAFGEPAQFGATSYASAPVVEAVEETTVTTTTDGTATTAFGISETVMSYKIEDQNKDK